MRIDEWKFSFEIAWDDLWFRLQSIITLLILFVFSGLFLWRLIPAGLENELLVFHYNQYLGIDAVQHWYWVFGYVALVFLVVFIDLLFSFRLYRHDRIASRLLLCASTFFVILMAIASHVITTANV